MQSLGQCLRHHTIKLLCRPVCEQPHCIAARSQRLKQDHTQCTAEQVSSFSPNHTFQRANHYPYKQLPKVLSHCLKKKKKTTFNKSHKMPIPVQCGGKARKELKRLFKFNFSLLSSATTLPGLCHPKEDSSEQLPVSLLTKASLCMHA